MPSTGEPTLQATSLITLCYDGYWREPKIRHLPDGAGVYSVYTCVHNVTGEKSTVSIDRLIYIGESDNIRARVENHNLWDTWRKQLRPGQVLCFAAALASPTKVRQRAEAALIFKHKPTVNVEYKHAFPFETTTIETAGRNEGLSPRFTVKGNSTD
jgi:hypothetical protein